MRLKVKYLVLLTQLLKLLLLLLKIETETDYNTKINEIEKRIMDHNQDKYITTPEFKKLTSEHLAARLK